MPLQKDWVVQVHFTAEDAYILLEKASWAIDGTVYAMAGIYKDATAYSNGDAPLDRVNFSFTHSGAASNIITQAYAALLLEPSMSGAIEI